MPGYLATCGWLSWEVRINPLVPCSPNANSSSRGQFAAYYAGQLQRLQAERFSVHFFFDFKIVRRRRTQEYEICVANIHARSGRS